MKNKKKKKNNEVDHSKLLPNILHCEVKGYFTDQNFKKKKNYYEMIKVEMEIEKKLKINQPKIFFWKINSKKIFFLFLGPNTPNPFTKKTHKLSYGSLFDSTGFFFVTAAAAAAGSFLNRVSLTRPESRH